MRETVVNFLSNGEKEEKQAVIALSHGETSTNRQHSLFQGVFSEGPNGGPSHCQKCRFRTTGLYTHTTSGYIRRYRHGWVHGYTGGHLQTVYREAYTGLYTHHSVPGGIPGRHTPPSRLSGRLSFRHSPSFQALWEAIFQQFFSLQALWEAIFQAVLLLPLGSLGGCL